VTTFKRICIKDFVVGNDFKIERAKEYITSAVDEYGLVTVFSRFWVSVPVSVFAGEIRFT
jgi:hypothetical protein